MVVAFSNKQFELFSSYTDLLHGVFLRGGGVSPPPYDSLNVGEQTGDRLENVAQNLEIMCRSLGIDRLIQGSQCHGSHLAWVTHASPSLIDQCDGLITKERGLGLLVKHADCQAALFFDPQQKIIGNVHAGWRGQVFRVYEKMVAQFVAAGSDPQNIRVCISPSLGPDHAQFTNYEKEFPSSFFSFQVKPFYFNLWEIARAELLSCGIQPSHIEIASICTFCDDRFFSFRRSSVTGRNGTVIALK